MRIDQLFISVHDYPKVAIKTIKKSKIETEADLIRIRREIQIMSSVQHPNIIHIYEGKLYIKCYFCFCFCCCCCYSISDICLHISH